MTEAQRLADTLCKTLTGKDPGLHISTCQQAIDELHRLDAREAELLALLRQARKLLIDHRDDVARNESVLYMNAYYTPALAAIQAATGEKP